MKRRDSLRLLAAMPFAPMPFMSGAAHAQGTDRGRGKVGYVLLGPRAESGLRLDMLRAGLRLANPAFAQAEIVAETTEGDPSRIVPLVTQVMATKPAVFVAAGPALLRAARQASDRVPIVAYDFETDPVGENYAQSIARPGSSVTGVFLDVPNFVGKWIEFLRECLPALKKITLLGDPNVGIGQAETLDRIARGFGMTTERVSVRVRDDLADGIAAAKKHGADAVILLSSPLVFVNGKELAELTLKHRLPAITMFADFARSGGLLAYGPDLMGALKQAGTMAGKILAGASPATLPIERPTTFELVVNLRTAQQLGVTVPPALKARADDVID
jgi:putative ABC transport system substrate-binding protein